MQHDDRVVTRLGVGHIERGVSKIRTRRKGGIGQNGMATEVTYHVNDLLIPASDNDGANVGFEASPPDMGDHRLVVDVGESLAWKPTRSQTGWYHDDRTHLCTHLFLHR